MAEHSSDGKENSPASRPAPLDIGVTREVGSEGGGEGDVELAIDRGVATGSEAGEVWHPSDEQAGEILRDETGEGRRSP